MCGASLLISESGLLKNLFYRSKKDRNLYHLDEDDTQETQELRRSFAELNLFQEPTPYGMWNLIGQFRQRPYETTMGAFCKITDALCKELHFCSIIIFWKYLVIYFLEAFYFYFTFIIVPISSIFQCIDQQKMMIAMWLNY